MPRPRSQLVHPAPTVRRTVAAACIGNAVEWYDFAIYGALGVVVTPVFFPSNGGAATLVVAFAVYATAFLVRPLGAALFGVRADAEGRRAVLVTVILIMSLATAAIGLLPGYAAIGVLAPCTLLVLRATQGLAAGGELGPAAVFITESAPEGRRGAFAAWHTATLALGLAAGLAVGSLVLLLPAEQVAAGWWRPAFLVALPLGLAGVYLRRRVTEPPIFLAAARSGSLEPRPIHELWVQHCQAWLSGFALVAAGALGFNTFFVFLPNHLVATSDRSGSAALLAGMVGLLVAAGAALALGALTDRIGRRPVVLSSLLVLTVGAVPMMALAEGGSLPGLVVVEVVAGVAIGGVLSVALLAEMFPTSVRATGLAMTAGLATAAVGGTGPLVDQLLYLGTGQVVAPGAYGSVVGCVALLGLRSWSETAFTDLT